MKNITLYLRHKRLDKGITIEEMAKALGTTAGTYSNKERGITQFNVDELQKVCFTLDIDKGEIVEKFFN